MSATARRGSVQRHRWSHAIATQAKHPRRINEITAAWVTDLLRAAGTIKQGAVRHADVKPLGEGFGLLSGQARVRLTYDREEAGAPASLVIKLPSTAPDSATFAESTHIYEREIRFYREVAPITPIRVPRVYATFLEPSDGTFILVMEDLGRLKLGDQVAGLSYDQVLSAARTIAPLHAKWWNGDKRRELPWVPSVEKQERYLNLSEERLREAWPAFLADLGDSVPPGGRALGERIIEKLDRVFETFNAGPRTLTHFDYRADNLFFDDPAKKESVVVLDWQLAMWGLGAYDIARLAGGSLPPAQRSNHHREIVNTWHAGLIAGGVKDYTQDQAWHDYRISAIVATLNPIIVHYIFKTGGKRGLALGAAMTQRLFYDLLECRAEEAIP